MFPRSLILVALLCVAGAGQAAVRIDCKPNAGGPCIQPPPPPAPPAPPAPPTLPGMPGMPPGIAPPAPPAISAPPPPPPPPPPPALPAVPERAHGACAARESGSTLTLELAPGETMSGLCERVNGRMVFQLRSYRRDD